MTEKTVTDKDGHSMKFVEYKGRRLPLVPSIAQKVDNLQNLKILSDDVLICGYPRSGTNWVWEVVTMLMSGVAENSKVSKLEYMLEYRDIPHFDKLPSPRILNSHLYMEHLPPGISEGRCKLLFIYRNPKDVAVSMYHFIKSDLLSDYEGTWDAFFDLYLKGEVMYGSWFEYTKAWGRLMQTRNDLNVFPLSYEDLKTDFTENVRRLSRFLGVERSDDFLAEVEMKCNFKNLKAAKDKCFDDEEKSFWRGGKPAYMRKGTVGDWKNTFTVAQNEAWDQMMDGELKDVKLKFRFT